MEDNENRSRAKGPFFEKMLDQGYTEVENSKISVLNLGQLREIDPGVRILAGKNDATWAYSYRLFFSNGWGASIIWGPCTYSDNHDIFHFMNPKPSENPEFVNDPLEVEIAIFDAEGEWAIGQIVNSDDHDGQVMGYVGGERLMAILRTTARMETQA